MTALDRHLQSIEDLCRQYRVGRLDLIGSAARGDFDASRSDYDFLVEFLPTAKTRALDVYFGFKERLEALLGRPVDLVIAGAVTNPYIRADLESTRRPLYAA